jgi:hypothetical protein
MSDPSGMSYKDVTQKQHAVARFVPFTTVTYSVNIFVEGL